MANPSPDVRRKGGKMSKELHQPQQGPTEAQVCAQTVLQFLQNDDKEGAGAYVDAMAKDLKHTSCKAFYHSVIHHCAKTPDANAALWIAMRMMRVGLKPNIVTFNSLIDACAKTGDLTLATSLWELIEELGLRPNVITYNTMINTCCQARDPRRAEWWIQKMISSGLQPCTVSFSTVMVAHAKVGNLEKVESWFAKMQAAGCQADHRVYNALIHAGTKSGQPEKAELWLPHMEASGFRPNEMTYNSLIHACAMSGNLRKADMWWERMIQNGFKLDKLACRLMIRACSDAGDPENAKRWLGAMIAAGNVADSTCYKSVLDAYLQNKDCDGAAAWIESVGTQLGPETAQHWTAEVLRNSSALQQQAESAAEWAPAFQGPEAQNQGRHQDFAAAASNRAACPVQAAHPVPAPLCRVQVQGPTKAWCAGGELAPTEGGTSTMQPAAVHKPCLSYAGGPVGAQRSAFPHIAQQEVCQAWSTISLGTSDVDRVQQAPAAMQLPELRPQPLEIPVTTQQTEVPPPPPTRPVAVQRADAPPPPPAHPVRVQQPGLRTQAMPMQPPESPPPPPARWGLMGTRTHGELPAAAPPPLQKDVFTMKTIECALDSVVATMCV